jgi:hypothetical protein
MADPIRITRFTRIVFALDLVFSLLAGGDLYLLSAHTDRYFAWTIKLPATATFLGAGYLSAVVTLVLGARANDWRKLRSIPVLGFTLTSVTLLVTLWHLSQFHLHDGSGFARIAAWSWLVVYATIPILLAAAFFRQERAAGPDIRAIAEPILPSIRAALLAQALGATVLGTGLIVRPSAFDRVWPWPLPPLSAGAVGAWLLTIAAGSWWALREGDWARLRAGTLGPTVFLVLVAAGAARYPTPLNVHAWQDWAFFAAIAASLVGFAGTVHAQQRAVDDAPDRRLASTNP